MRVSLPKFDEIGPEYYKAFSSVSVHWKCSNGHEWMDTINNATRRKFECAYCEGLKSYATEENCVLNPKHGLIEQWDYNKNNIKPSSLSIESTVKVFWKCGLGHSYKQSPKNRLLGMGCYYCSGHRVLKGFNDLESKYPEISAEFHKKNNMRADDIHYGSSKKVWTAGNLVGYINIGIY